MVRRHDPSQSGFTLVELVTVISVLAILASLAAPGFARLLEAQRVRSAAFDLVSDLLLARSEATKHAAAGEVVHVSPSDDGWAAGWSVTQVNGDRVVSQRNAISADLLFIGAPTAIAFDRDGRVVTDSDIRFSIRGPSQAETEGSCIELDATGRARSVKGSCP
ncbi:GspH/FimT family pseudopilin [Aquabacterium sp. A7-Y]|uniref:GspH/FimT family pseudopilin n=1 Tax=Aquabacterium sp. A7-Y TaxID=1349605 RepID=UPI00223DD4D4|nr:GspH/FimT family pseudopilin [Aquabacterium sp. A7-Y]MCW7539435.1 GspH/FimT family pseudopilin [Aquabacterium sp. A7-Y]